MVDREVDRPVWVILDRCRGLCVRSWAALGAYVGGLGAVLVPWLGPVSAILGPMFAILGPLLAVLGCLGPKSGRNLSEKQIPIGRAVTA